MSVARCLSAAHELPERDHEHHAGQTWRTVQAVRIERVAPRAMSALRTRPYHHRENSTCSRSFDPLEPRASVANCNVCALAHESDAGTSCATRM
jgi:hypothetical protein